MKINKKLFFSIVLTLLSTQITFANWFFRDDSEPGKIKTHVGNEYSSQEYYKNVYPDLLNEDEYVPSCDGFMVLVVIARASVNNFEMVEINQSVSGDWTDQRWSSYAVESGNDNITFTQRCKSSSLYKPFSMDWGEVIKSVVTSSGTINALAYNNNNSNISSQNLSDITQAFGSRINIEITPDYPLGWDFAYTANTPGSTSPQWGNSIICYNFSQCGTDIDSGEMSHSSSVNGNYDQTKVTANINMTAVAKAKGDSYACAEEYIRIGRTYRGETSDSVGQLDQVASYRDFTVHGNTVHDGCLKNSGNMPDSGDGFMHYLGTNEDVDFDDWTSYAVYYQIKNAADDWHTLYPNGPRLQFGDISKQYGGPFTEGAPNRLSHQNGTDIDIRYVRDDGEGRMSFTDPDPKHYDLNKTIELINTIFANCNVERIIIDSRSGITITPASKVTYDSTNVHSDHFHLRLVNPHTGTCN